MRRFRLCQHTKDNGELCGSPAMRGKNYCYFHLEVVRRRRAWRAWRENGNCWPKLSSMTTGFWVLTRML
jgi:hypothetical protein